MYNLKLGRKGQGNAAIGVVILVASFMLGMFLILTIKGGLPANLPTADNATMQAYSGNMVTSYSNTNIVVMVVIFVLILAALARLSGGRQG